MSLDEAQKLAADLTKQGVDAVKKYGSKSDDLCELAEYLLNRRK